MIRQAWWNITAITNLFICRTFIIPSLPSSCSDETHLGVSNSSGLVSWMSVVQYQSRWMVSGWPCRLDQAHRLSPCILDPVAPILAWFPTQHLIWPVWDLCWTGPGRCCMWLVSQATASILCSQGCSGACCVGQLKIQEQWRGWEGQRTNDGASWALFLMTPPLEEA